MKCKYCEAEITKSEKICHNCGRFLGKEEAETAVESRRKLWIILGVIAIAAVFVLTTFWSSFFQQKATNEHLEKQVAVTSANNLGMNFEKFKDAFNQNEYAEKAKLKIGEPELLKGDKNTQFQQLFTEKLALSGVIGKIDHKLLALQLIAIPSSVKDDHIRMITAMGILIDMFSPDVPEEERGEILKELGFSKDADLYKADNTATRGNVLYRFKFVENTGFVFLVSNINYRG